MPNDLFGTSIPPGTLMVPSGRPGAQGWGANSLIAAPFTVPPIGGTVAVEFVNTTWLAVDAVIFVGGMYGRVVSVNGTTVVLERIVGGVETGVGIEEAPAGPQIYGRQAGSWLPVLPLSDFTQVNLGGPFLPIAGGTVTGALGVNGAVSFSTTLNVANNVTFGSDLVVTGNQTLNTGLTVGTTTRFAALVTTDFTAFRRADIGARVYQFASNWFMQWRESDGNTSFGNGAGTANSISFTGGGVLSTAGSIFMAGWGIAYANWTNDQIGIFRQAGVGYHLVLNGASAGMITLTPSDERLKDNTVAATEDTLAVLRGVETYSFDQRDTGDYRYSQHADVGFIAQQLRTVMPDAVVSSPRVPTKRNMHKYTDDEALFSIQPLPLIARCVRGLQQLADRLDALDQRLAATENQNGRPQQHSTNNGTVPRGRNRRTGDREP